MYGFGAWASVCAETLCNVSHAQMESTCVKYGLIEANEKLSIEFRVLDVEVSICEWRTFDGA